MATQIAVCIYEAVLVGVGLEMLEATRNCPLGSRIPKQPSLGVPDGFQCTEKALWGICLLLPLGMSLSRSLSWMHRR